MMSENFIISQEILLIAIIWLGFTIFRFLATSRTVNLSEHSMTTRKMVVADNNVTETTFVNFTQNKPAFALIKPT